MSKYDKSTRHDRFYRRAKKSGVAARSYFKLEEIDQKHHLFRAGARVLDLGCRPGSWLQYAAQRVGDTGALVGVDRAALDISLPQARVLVGDVHKLDPPALLGSLTAFDVVLSDMAPDTSGIRAVDQARSEALFERALEIALFTLAPGGHFVGKLFQGPCFGELVARCRAGFAKVAIVKPKSSRAMSIEQYVVALARGPG